MVRNAGIPANLIGELPPRFAEVRRLGEGSEGGAWGAVLADSGRKVVLKHVQGRRRTVVARAFALLSRVSSPHLPEALELFNASRGGAWLVTGWVDGEPLGAGPVQLASALGEALAVAHALRAIHEAGTHHGDVSPANILVTATRGIVLIDLGQVGSLGAGTPGFLAPETLAGGGGAPADRFALASVVCLRLFGEVPWRDPQALSRLRTGAAVRTRLRALMAAAGVTVPGPVLSLLEHLLHPIPERRLQDPGVLVERLARLHAAAQAGIDLRPETTWWLPARWPYRGVSLERTLKTLSRADPPRLVAVAGPAGVGRGRVVEELARSLQERLVVSDGEGRARLCDAARVGSALGRPGELWLEAWINGSRGDEAASFVGVPAEPAWPEALIEDGLAKEERLRLQAAVLCSGASMAGATLCMAVSSELGRELATRNASGVHVLEVRPWDKQTIAGALEPVLDCDDIAPWVDVLARATGSWPARVVRAARCCERAGLDRPDPGGLARALADADLADAVELDTGLARAVLEAAWTGELDATLPVHLHDGDRPLAWAVVAARRLLKAEVAVLARAVIDRLRRDKGRIGLGLALDADAAEEIDGLLRERAVLAVDDADVIALLEWLERGGAQRVGAEARTMVVRHLIREGEARRALALARAAEPSTASELEAARALQQLGRSAEALSVLDKIAGAAELDGNAQLRDLHTGLRWRLLVDLGREDEALAEARERTAGLQARSGTGTAVAFLWAGYAALTGGDGELARAWLERARNTCIGDDPEEAGIRARALQLLGNLALGVGDLLRAQAEYRRAATAFEVARETVGRLLVRGSLAGIAVPTLEIAQGVEHGRAAVRGLLARGLLQSLPEVGANLVQLLARTGSAGEGRALHEMLANLVSASTQLGPVARAHLQRMAAELAAADLVGQDGTSPAQRSAAERLFVAAARALEEANAGREAVEGWLRAAALARVDGRLPAASAHLERAAAMAEAHADAGSLVGVGLERLAAATAAGDTGAVEGAVAALAELPRAPELAARGQLDLAWSYDKVLLPALRRLDANKKTRRAVARRLLGTLEVLMKKASALDRPAVRSSLLSNDGDRGALRELIEELGEAAPRDAVEGTHARAHDPQGVRFQQLLRMYRRLAREDDLERLLEQVVEAIMDLTEAERGVVVVRPSDDGPRMEVARELAAGSDGVAFSRSVIERVLESGEPVLSVDAAEDDRFDQSRSISHLNLRSVLAVPLRFRGEVLGAAYVDHRLRRGNFDESDLARVEEFAELAALAVAHASALAAVRTQATEIDQQRLEVSRLLEIREAEVQGLRDQVRSTQVPERKVYRGMVGATAAMQDVFRLVDRLSESEVPVVLCGESGTGKELVARAIHEAGPRATKPFVAENCAAIPETLLESVLFGHARGAFTGAQRAKAGLFEAADGGTIFLDEIGEMSPAMQTKLLRVLQEGEVRRVGENVERKVDVRVIAASNMDLDEIAERGNFRRDLYYRLNVVKIELPPLRRRSEDIPALVAHFLGRHDPEGRVSVSAAAMRVLATFAWPGNVRQLENEVQRWVALCEGTVTPDDLSPAITGADDDGIDPDDLRIRPRVDMLERELIERALERTAGNQTRAAELLGLSRYGLQKKLRRLSEEGER